MGKFADELLPKFADSSEPTLASFKQGTLAWLCQKYIEEMADPGGRKIGDSQYYTLRRIQLAPIGSTVARDLKVADFVQRARTLKTKPNRNGGTGLLPASIGHDFIDMSVVLKYASDVWEIDGLDKIYNLLRKAKRELKRQGLIAKSARRKRRPTLEEIARLLEAFEKSDAHPNAVCKMAPLQAAAIVTSRRLGELCRITFGDILWDKGTYWVRDVKHPTRKKGNDKEFTLLPEFAEIVKRQPRLTDRPDERVFPYDAKTASQRGTKTRKRLGIVGLHFHDNRREAISRWLKKLPPHKVRQYISGHDTTAMVETVYDAPEAADLHLELDSLMQPKPDDRRSAMR